jgi:hypothetical protein
VKSSSVLFRSRSNLTRRENETASNVYRGKKLLALLDWSKDYYPGTTKKLGGEKMKKILVLAVIALFVMMPFASFAKTAVSDSDLGAVTAQTGVSIDFTNLSVTGVTMDVQSWGDNDGFSGYASAGWTGANMALVGSVVALSGTMNIDVGTSGTQTRLKIDLPTVSIGGSGGLNVDQIQKLAADKILSTNAGTLGQSYMGGLKATVSGSLQIYAH